jgi:hypothetical protein
MELSGLDLLLSKSDAQVDEVRNGRCQRRRRLGVEQSPRPPAIAGYGLPFVVDIPIARYREISRRPSPFLARPGAPAMNPPPSAPSLTQSDQPLLADVCQA